MERCLSSIIPTSHVRTAPDHQVHDPDTTHAGGDMDGLAEQLGVATMKPFGVYVEDTHHLVDVPRLNDFEECLPFSIAVRGLNHVKLRLTRPWPSQFPGEVVKLGHHG
jgi:hypothetical protein